MLWIVLCYASPLGAAVYKWVDAEGVVHYSDEPEAGAGAKRITLPELSVVPFRIPPAPVTETPSPTAPAQNPRGLLPPVSPSPSPEAQSPAPQAAEPGPMSSGGGRYYQQLTILLPANNETLSESVDDMDVTLALIPDLQVDHRIEVLLDGQRIQDAFRTTRFTISGLEPGSHILEARVVDPEGKVLRRSKSVLFHYQP
jgi:hypothetical protein